MSVRELNLHPMKASAPEELGQHPGVIRPRISVRRWLTAASVAVAITMALSMAAGAQSLECRQEGQDLVRVPELVSKDGRLRATLVLRDEQQRMTFRVPVSAPSNTSRSQCFPQYVRFFTGIGAVPAPPPTPPGGYPDPLPGPTLRARVGDMIELTFINQINPANFGDSIDRGETGEGGGCDESSSGYPGTDKFPDCFHGSSTGNIHYHGTHTNPNTTGDNVFIEVRPSLRGVDGNPLVTPESVRKPFDQFFDVCEAQLGSNTVKEWPTSWSDLPSQWTQEQKRLLQAYDSEPAIKRKLWPVNEKQIKMGAWPQYYIGAFPYCYRLPKYTPTVWPPPVSSTDHAGMLMGAAAPEPPLIMGQSPGTHWYHAHKHGSTAIDVANGMTGAFIIEGQYDDDLNKWYGSDWTRTQPVMVINQLGVSPNLMRGGAGRIDKGPDFSINGRLKPVVQMRPGEVQMWRLLNTSGRAGIYFA
ncbi:MAG TPA: hypothetical protein VJX67_10530, partial [Blastocatellia bacterium]|nr:hypothetical protein [Blastocatellia bacterium]